MGLLSLFNKKQSSTQLTRPQKPTLEQVTNHLLKTTEEQIQSGLSKSTASTGTPIEDLRGAAKAIAQLSNIGGGSIASGGGGMEKGMNTVTMNAQARTAKAIIERNKTKRIEKK